MSNQPVIPKQTDQDESKGAVEGDRPTDTQQGNKNAAGRSAPTACRKTASPLPKTSSAPTRIRPKARELVDWKMGRLVDFPPPATGGEAR